jgi:ABC-2 type transport system ATP-binding protein
MNIISAEDVSKHFSNVRAVDGLTLQVAQGQIYGLVGPDGAGKTTFLRLLCGALEASGGRIDVAGFPLPSQIEKVRALIGYLPQRFSLYEELTVLENLRFFAEVRGIPSRDWRPRSESILEFVGLGPFRNRRAGQLSGGMKQKLGLAAALVHRPLLLLLDEPTTGVDPVTRQSFWQLIIRQVAEEGVSVLVSTPYMDEASRCNRVGFLRAGKLLVEGTPGELQSRLHERVLEAVGTPLSTLRMLAKQITDVENAQMFGDRLHLRIRHGATENVIRLLRESAAQAGVSMETVRQIAPGLEDIFISLLEDNA